VLHPDDRNLGRATFLDTCPHRNDAVPVVRATHHAVLHVDHENCGVRAVFECRHRLQTPTHPPEAERGTSIRDLTDGPIGALRMREVLGEQSIYAGDVQTRLTTG
jgi:hypothetical protein